MFDAILRVIRDYIITKLAERVIGDVVTNGLNDEDTAILDTLLAESEQP